MKAITVDGSEPGEGEDRVVAGDKNRFYEHWYFLIKAYNSSVTFATVWPSIDQA